MKNFLCTLILAFSLNIANAQPQSKQIEKQTLIQRLDSLEHNLDYLKIDYDLKTINTDLTTLVNEINIKILSIQLDIYTKNFSFSLLNIFKDYYDATLHQKETLYTLAEAKKELCMLKLTTYPFSELERNTLTASCNLIDKRFSRLETYINALKEIIDVYKSFI